MVNSLQNLLLLPCYRPLECDIWCLHTHSLNSIQSGLPHPVMRWQNQSANIPSIDKQQERPWSVGRHITVHTQGRTHIIDLYRPNTAKTAHSPFEKTLGRHGLAWWIFHFGEIASYALNGNIKGEKGYLGNILVRSNLLWVEWMNLWWASGFALFSQDSLRIVDWNRKILS